MGWGEEGRPRVARMGTDNKPSEPQSAIRNERSAVAWRVRLRLLWGKARRLWLAIFRPRYVRESIGRRSGECRRCGACCQLGHRCPFLRHTGEITECRFHRFRPGNCRNFPIDERDLADRDLVAPDQPCGFTFKSPK